MTTQIDQKAYLQKYLGGTKKDKKKKKKKNYLGKGMKIIDDDVDVSKMRPLEVDELDVFGEGEDAPQIAGIIDERPEEIKKLEQFKTSSKWRVINQDDGFNSNLKVTEVKKDIKEVEKENEITFGKMYSDSEDEKKNDSDVSPPRKKNGAQGRKTKARESDSDISPPRRKESRVVSKNQGNNDSDQSPPRTHNKVKELNRNRRGNGSDSDISPPRRKEKRSSHKNQNDNDSDLSPPRKNDGKVKEKSRARKESRWGYFETEEQYEAKNSKSRDKSPSTKKRRDSDQSPPRKRKEKSPDSDLSPPRKNPNEPNKDIRDDRYRNPSKPESSSRYRDESSRIPEGHKKSGKSYEEADESPPRRKKRYPDEHSDKNKHRQSETNRRRNGSDSDQSPPRKNLRQSPKRAPERYRNERPNNDQRKHESSTSQPSNSRMTKTLEGKMAGLQDARQLRRENDEFRRKEDDAFKRLSDDVSGRNAKAVARRGKRETSEDREKLKQKAERQKEIDAKYQRWGKGLKQIEDQEARYQDYLHESSKPLARHKGDTDLEDSLKQVERDGDPMLKYIREKKRERGELGPEKPIYKGNFPPNRFNIRPGYRWDGVDRSNGYEKKYFQHQSSRKAQEEEAYKWSTEDL